MSELLQSKKLEDAVIGTLIQLFEYRPILLPKLSPDSFEDRDNRAIFEAISELDDSGKEVDLLSVEQWLRDHKKWGDQDVANLVGYDAIYQDPEQKVDDLNDKRNTRNLLKGLESVIRSIRTEPKTSTEHVAQIEKVVRGQIEHIDIPGLSMSEIEERDQHQQKFEQLYVGDKFFDHTYFSGSGSRKGQFEVILGRPKHGKTHFALWRTKQYVEQGYKGLFYTMESNDREIYNRLRGYFGENNDNVKIIDKSGVSNLAEIMQTTKYWKAAWGVDFIVVDYLQRVPVEGISYHDETKRIVTCSNYLTDMAVKENVLCIGLAQPSNPERHSRKGYKMEPEVYDIYGSGAIEKDAFMVSSVFRPSEIDELQFLNYQGEIRGVKAPGSDDERDMLHKDTVFIRQKVVREGSKYVPFVKFIHNNSGLERVISKAPF